MFREFEPSFKIFKFIDKYYRSTPNSSTTADSGVDNPTFRIETEGLNGDIGDSTQSSNINQEVVSKNEVKDNGCSNSAIKITLTTNTGTHSEHPDSAVWNKSPFTKKYKTHPPRANGKILILIYRYINYQNRRTFMSSYQVVFMFLCYRWQNSKRNEWKIKCI